MLAGTWISLFVQEPEHTHLRLEQSPHIIIMVVEWIYGGGGIEVVHEAEQWQQQCLHAEQLLREAVKVE